MTAGPSAYTRVLWSEELASRVETIVPYAGADPVPDEADLVPTIGRAGLHVELGPLRYVNPVTSLRLYDGEDVELARLAAVLAAGTYVDAAYIEFEGNYLGTAEDDGFFSPRLLRHLTESWGTPLYVGLMHTDPLAVADPLAVELIGPTYAREDLTAVLDDGSLVEEGRLTNGDSMLWTGLPTSTTVVALALFDEHVNGNLLWSHKFDEPYRLTQGGSLLVPAGGFQVLHRPGLDV